MPEAAGSSDNAKREIELRDVSEQEVSQADAGNAWHRSGDTTSWGHELHLLHLLSELFMSHLSTEAARRVNPLEKKM